jgi:hypothetical protein
LTARGGARLCRRRVVTRLCRRALSGSFSMNRRLLGRIGLFAAMAAPSLVAGGARAEGERPAK